MYLFNLKYISMDVNTSSRTICIKSKMYSYMYMTDKCNM